MISYDNSQIAILKSASTTSFQATNLNLHLMDKTQNMSKLAIRELPKILVARLDKSESNTRICGHKNVKICQHLVPIGIVKICKAFAIYGDSVN